MRIPVRLKLTARRGRDDRHAEPVTFGVPLPCGQADPGEQWQFRFANGSTAPVQTRVLDRWSDGSVRWLLVDGQVPPMADRDTDHFLERGRSETEALGAVTVVADAHSVTVATGPSTFVVKIGGSFPFAAVESDGRQVLNALGTGLFVTDSTGKEGGAEILSVDVEERGPLRTVILVRGRARAGSARELLLTARLHFFSGLSTVRVMVALTNSNAAAHPGGFWDLGSAGSVLIKDVCLSLAITNAPAAVARVSPEREVPAFEATLPFELYQDSSGGESWQSSNHINRERRIPTSFRGYRLRTGGRETVGMRATPIVSIGTVGSAITVAIPHFWQNFPQAIEAVDGLLKWRLFPGQFSDFHEIQGGEQKTFECCLNFGSGGCDALEWCRSPLATCADPAWVFLSDAVPFLAPFGSAHAELVNSAVDGPDRFELKREVIDEYGWRHFGEIYGDHESVRQKEPPVVSHYNNQYDPVAGFILQYLRTADARWWTMAQELALHVIDIDIYHTTRDKSAYNGGLFWHTYHYGDADTATHRTYPSSAKGRTHGGGPSADHNYTTGLMLHYFLTGDEASRESVIGLGQFVMNIDDGKQTIFRWLDTADTGRAILSNGYYGPGRGPANSLNALIDAHRLSNSPLFLAKAEQVIRRVVHPEEDISRHRLDDTEHRWFYTMFLQVLGKYLDSKTERRELDAAYAYGRDVLIHYARWIVAHEQPWLSRPEKLEFPTETWAAQDIRKSDILYFAALYAEPDERSVFESRARFYHEESLRTLHAMPTRFLARPVIVLAGSGFMDGWRACHPDAAMLGQRQRVAHAPQSLFAPQRQRAERKAKVLAAVMGLGVTLAALWLFL